MKLHLELLRRIVDVPSQDPEELRHVLDDLGLEVKGIESEGGKTVFNIETLANRGDHLYALGVAREFSARYLSQLRVPPMIQSLPEKAASIPVYINTEKCMRYALMEMQLPSRMSLRGDVAAIMGTGSDKHPIVDTLNYIQLELGQPMHAFDKDKIEGEIRVELSTVEEEIEALDGKKYKVPAGSILICDRRKTVAVGGVIGCANSMVTSGTTRVLLESASFDPVSVRRTARGMGISTDASYVFERGCDPEMVHSSLKRVAYLTGSTPGVTTDQPAHVLGMNFVERQPVEVRQVKVRLATLRTQFNLPRLAEVEVVSRLKNLGYGVKQDEKQFTVTVPSWRLWDVRDEEDVVEDFIRSHGLNGVKQELPPLSCEEVELNAVEKVRDLLDEIFHGEGFLEAITQSFYSPQDVDFLASLDPGLPPSLVRIRNAVEGNFAFLRHSSILQLSRLARSNMRMNVSSCKVYEYTRHFSRAHAEDSPYDFESDMLVFASSGRWYENDWKQEESRDQKVKLFKGLIESIGNALGCKLVVVPSSNPCLHPGCQGEIRFGRISLGVFGLIHPLLKEYVGASGDIFYGELSVARILRAQEERPYPVPSDYPMIKRDLTLKVPARSYAGKISGWIREAKPAHLKGISITDDFRKGDEDFRRVTYRLSFQSAERTLEHAEIDAEVTKLLETLKEKHQVEMA